MNDAAQTIHETASFAPQGTVIGLTKEATIFDITHNLTVLIAAGHKPELVKTEDGDGILVPEDRSGWTPVRVERLRGVAASGAASGQVRLFGGLRELSTLLRSLGV